MEGDGFFNAIAKTWIIVVLTQFFKVSCLRSETRKYRLDGWKGRVSKYLFTPRPTIFFFKKKSGMQFLSSKVFSPRLLRCYSTSQADLKLWVKHNGGPSVKVPINGCTDLDDFAEKVKQKLNTNCQVLFSSKGCSSPWAYNQ